MHANGLVGGLIEFSDPTTISDDMFGPRVRDLGERARTLKARRDELEQAADLAAMDPPAQTDIDTLRTELAHIVANGTDAHRKAAAQAFVHRLVVVEPGVIQPTFLIRGGIPTDPVDNPDQTAPTSASRAVTKMVGKERQSGDGDAKDADTSSSSAAPDGRATRPARTGRQETQGTYRPKQAAGMQVFSR